MTRGLETRPAPADLPADRVHLRPRRRRPRQGRAGRAALRPAAGHLRRPARGIRPGGVQGRQHVAGGGLDGPGVLLPAPAGQGTATAPTPRRPGDTARTTCCAARTSCSSATTCRPPIMMPDENGPAVPELARRAILSSCRHDPVRALAPVLTAMPAAGIPLGDILADSGYAHRDAAAWAIPLRRAGAQLVQDLHPHDRGPKGTHDGADHRQREPVLPVHAPPAAGTRAARPHRHGRRTGRRPRRARPPRLARYKLGRITADDADGYHRVACPAATGKIRCPLRPASMTLDRDRPEILAPPEHPPACCTQQTITVPAESQREDRAETRLPVESAPPLLRPPHRRRTRLRHRQRPRRQRHRPRLVPPDGPGAPHAVHHDACSSSATSASSPPGTPGRKKTSAAPPKACPRKPGAAAARPSPH